MLSCIEKHVQAARVSKLGFVSYDDVPRDENQLQMSYLWQFFHFLINIIIYVCEKFTANNCKSGSYSKNMWKL